MKGKEEEEEEEGRRGTLSSPASRTPSPHVPLVPIPTATTAMSRKPIKGKQVGGVTGRKVGGVVTLSMQWHGKNADFADTGGFNIEMTRSFVGMNLKSVTVRSHIM